MPMQPGIYSLLALGIPSRFRFASGVFTSPGQPVLACREWIESPDTLEPAQPLQIQPREIGTESLSTYEVFTGDQILSEWDGMMNIDFYCIANQQMRKI